MRNLLSVLKSHRYFVLLYGGLYTAFLWPLLLFQKTFIFGDYWQQHYPWAYEYARALKAGTLPYWVSGVAAGFPLVAEGQVGAYYPPHLLLYRVLPFSIAYTLVILLHVLFGGFGFYVYGRKMGFSKEAAAWLAVLFSFSSAYGGCFSNTAVLRVMAWLPWCLLAWDDLGAAAGNERARFLWVSVLGSLFALMGTAGAPQMALYAVFYLSLLWMVQTKGKRAADLLAAGLLGALLSLPQWAATLELMGVSARSGETRAFALWGSVLPTTLASLVFPEWGSFWGVALYLGAAPLLLLLLAAFSEKNRLEKIHWAFAGLFILLALGRYGPFFWFATGFLRNPSKWLFFSTVSLAFLAAGALGRLEKLKARKALVIFPAAVATLPLLARAVYQAMQKPLGDFARRSAQLAYSGKRDPFRGISYYQSKAESLLARLGKLFDYSNLWNLVAIAFFILSAAVLWKAAEKKSVSFWRGVALPLVLAADLLVFGSFLGAGFTGNARTYPEKLAPAVVSAIRARQSVDDSAVVGWTDGSGQEALPANTNLLYGVNHAGGYSPLLLGRYYELSKDLGISDASLGHRPYSEEVWKKEPGIVRVFGISQVLSEKSLRTLEGPTPFAWLAHDWKKITDEKERLLFLKSDKFRPLETAVLESEPCGLVGLSASSGTSETRLLSKTPTEIVLKVDSAADAVLAMRLAYYPRWKAVVDGLPDSVMPVDHAFSGLFISAGKHKIRFFYDARPHKLWEGMALAAFLALLSANLFFTFNRKNAR